jgi:hypothetical protein
MIGTVISAQIEYSMNDSVTSACAAQRGKKGPKPNDCGDLTRPKWETGAALLVLVFVQFVTRSCRW